MTVEEVRDRLKELIKDRESFMVGDYDKDIYDRDKEALEFAVKALKKQMPKKPYFREEEGAKGYACPSCDMGVEIRLFQGGCVKERFCSCCGQALDWSSENENTAEN